MIDTGRACNSLDVRSYRTANCDSDHCSVPSNDRGWIKTIKYKSNVRRQTPNLHTKWPSGENGTTTNTARNRSTYKGRIAGAYNNLQMTSDEVLGCKYLDADCEIANGN